MSTAPSATSEWAGRGARRTLIGVVASDKMNKTRLVLVTRRVAHGTYQKYVVRRVKYKAHDERNEYKVGDRVEIIESKPISREKRWRIERLIAKAEEV